MVLNVIPLTLEQAAALRTILKYEFVGRTGELFKTEEIKPTETLNSILRNAELWGKLDNTIAGPMVFAYRMNAELSVRDTINVEMGPVLIEQVQIILKTGTYKKTLETANSTKAMQTSLGSTIPVVCMQRNIDALLQAFDVKEKPEMVFFPMKAVGGLQ